MEFKDLNITPAQLSAMQTTAKNHLMYAHVEVTVLEASGNTLTVRVKQTRQTSDTVYTPQELIQFGKDVFSHTGNQFTIQWRPVVFSGEGIEAVSPRWVKQFMKDYGLKQTDLCAELKIDKHVMSKIMNGEYQFTRWHQAAFFYYFLYKKSLKNK